MWKGKTGQRGEAHVDSNIVAIDALLAAALRRENAFDHQVFAAADSTAAVVERINYHGISGLLRATPGAMAGWPEAIMARVRDGAVAQAIWELRHGQFLNHLLGELAAANITAILLKGTALAYDLYAAPATRDRGDSDLLIDPCDLVAARLILARQGFERVSGDDGQDDFCLQEVWSRTCERDMDHHIDLHWHLLNAPALEGVLPFAECAATRIALPRLGPDAYAMDRVRTLIHTCIHRTLNFSSPYFVNGRTYYGGDRLIWLHDIHLFAEAFSPAEWEIFCRLAESKGMAAVCLDGLSTAQRVLGTPLPPSVRDALGAGSMASGPPAYMRAGQLGRAWRDLQAIPGLRRKMSYFRARVLPTPNFIRDKYPRHAGLPLPLLYARRLFDLVRARPTQSPKR